MADRILYLGFTAIYIYGIVMVYYDDIIRILPKKRISEMSRRGGKLIIKMIIKKKKEIPDRELLKSSIILKNLSLVRKGTPMSADYIYEKLMENSGYLKSMYSEMITLYRSGRDEEAFNIPSKIIGTKAAKNFAIILSKLDKIDPAELTEQMNVFQSSMTDRQMSMTVKKNQRNSMIITALASVSVFALLINFTVVVVFMNSMEMLSQIFI